jgi:hypothetical protein
MPSYVADFEYSIREFGSVTLDADDKEQAEDMAYEYVRDTYPDVTNIDVTNVNEVTTYYVGPVGQVETCALPGPRVPREGSRASGARR